MDIEDTIQLGRLRMMLKSGAGRSVRLAAGLSLGEVARACGVGSESTILRWETCERRPRGEAGLRYWALLRGLMEGPR